MGRNTPSFTAIGFWNAARRFGSSTSWANGVHGSAMPPRSALVAVDCASAPHTAATLHSPRAMRFAASSGIDVIFSCFTCLLSCDVLFAPSPSLRGALATKQSILSFRRAMDCFASLAMTVWEGRLFLQQRVHMFDGLDEILLEFLHHGAG